MVTYRCLLKKTLLQRRGPLRPISLTDGTLWAGEGSLLLGYTATAFIKRRVFSQKTPVVGHAEALRGLEGGPAG